MLFTKILPYVQSKYTFFNFEPAGHTSCDAAQAMADFLGCKCSFSSPVHQDSLVLLHRVVLNLFILQSALIFQTVLTQVQKLAFGLDELHEVHMGPHLKPVSSQTGLEVAVWNG